MQLKKILTIAAYIICLSPFMAPQAQAMEKGLASYYAHKFQGRKTANGQRYDKQKFTAAHKSLAFGSKVKVTNLRNKRSVIVTINDRGPFVKKRIIDLSYIAAKKLGLTKSGIAPVKVTVLKGK
ncbi:MAG: septal ring lytic transglycosylase RlpA family protein [Methylococcaceae bacterium]|nr:septal ring lytic transglycosylase RlpA family protein [Methylococcaceae bacterium]